MSTIARAFTLRSRRKTSTSELPLPPPPLPGQPLPSMNSNQVWTASRSGTYQGPGKHVDRKLISAPTFITTTNTLALNAPDISQVRGMRKASSSVSSGSSRGSAAEDSDSSSIRTGARDTQLTDASSVDNSPSGSPHLRDSSTFHSSKARTAALAGRSRSSYDLRGRAQSSTETSPEVPQIPLRAPSHSKRAHEQLHKKRSLQQLSSIPAGAQPFAPVAPINTLIAQRAPSRDGPLSSKPAAPLPQQLQREQRVSLDIFNANIDLAAHPFGAELEQLNAVVEDYSHLHRDADVAVMRDRRLARFCADDYILEIQPLFQRCFGPPMIQVDPVGGWI